MSFKIEKNRSALLVVDLQEDFVSPSGALHVPETLRQLPRIKNLIKTCRSLGVPVIYTAHVQDRRGHDFGLSTYFVPQIREGALREGSKGAEIYSEIRPEPKDIVVFKRRYSAFYGTDLEIVLKGLNVDTLIICGTTSDICCDSTARDAFFRDYKVIFGSDITSTFDPKIHASVLTVMGRMFARVMSCDEIIKELSADLPDSSV